MDGNIIVGAFISLKYQYSGVSFNLPFVRVEFIWHDVLHDRKVIIFLDRNRERMAAFVPRNLLHLYSEVKLLGGVFSLSHFQVEKFHRHEYPKYENYYLIYGDLKIIINENTILTSVAVDIENSFPFYPLLFPINTLCRVSPVRKLIIDFVGKVVDGKRIKGHQMFVLFLKDVKGCLTKMKLYDTSDTYILRTYFAISRKYIIYASRVKLVPLPSINLLVSTKFTKIVFQPDVPEAQNF